MAGWPRELFQYILYIGLSPKDLNPHPFLRIDGCWSSLSAAEFRGAVVEAVIGYPLGILWLASQRCMREGSWNAQNDAFDQERKTRLLL
jgi:hypothetical protein